MTAPEYRTHLEDRFAHTNFVDQIWFYKGLVDGFPTDQFIKDVEAANNLKDAKMGQDPADVRDVLQYLFLVYLHEIWISETVVPDSKKVDTVEIVTLLFEENGQESFDAFYNRVISTGLDQRTAKKIWNLADAAFSLFGRPSIFPVATTQPLSVSVVKSINARIGDGLFDGSGEYRQKLVGASQSSVTYCLPRKIEARLKTLLDFVNETKEKLNGLKDVIRLAALFFSEFLLIHPFPNGNGRTARLLTNLLLHETTVIPFSLYYKDRGLYLEVLEERNDGSPPCALANYMLCCLRKTATTFTYLTLD